MIVDGGIQGSSLQDLANPGQFLAPQVIAGQGREASSESGYADLAVAEITGIRHADVMIVILPGGRGTHVEIGAALAMGKPVIIHAPNRKILETPYPCAFHVSRNGAGIAARCRHLRLHSRSPRIWRQPHGGLAQQLTVVSWQLGEIRSERIVENWKPEEHEGRIDSPATSEAVNIFCDNPQHGSFRLRLTSQRKRLLIADSVVDTRELEEVRKLVSSHLASWAGPLVVERVD